MFILQDETSRFTLPFIDDIAFKSVKTQYKRADGSYKNIPENLGIHCFIWNTYRFRTTFRIDCG